ncbi:MAG: methyltransferase domain-containing protein [Bacteroidetes bacterium]|nr:methyltransferase domain-containing protein [Bacteroidota bacterium]
MKKYFLFLIILSFISLNYFAQKYAGELAKTEFNLEGKKLNSFYEMSETKKTFLNFTEIKKGDVVAEIGAANGVNPGIMSTFCDSVTFYAQDIDEKTLSQDHLNSTVAYYLKFKTKGQTNTFKRVIGTITNSNLPDGLFDKIFIILSYHDFDKKDEMLDDIYKKLKPDGKLLINDGFSFPGDTIKCYEDGCHPFPLLVNEIRRCEQHGFYLTKMRNPNFHASNYGNFVIFEKNKTRSDAFYKKKNEVDTLVNKLFLLNQEKNAEDSVLVKQITNMLQPQITKIKEVYYELDTWIKEIGLKYLRKPNDASAINILKLNAELFPDSYQANYWLGVAYQRNKQNVLALEKLKLSLLLEPGNTNAEKRINALTKK